MARGGALLDAAAKALNLTTQQLTDKLSDGKTTIADVAKQQNVDINKVIDAIANADRSRISAIVNQPWPKPGAGPDGRPGDGFRRGAGLFGPGFGRRGAVALDPVAKALGITTDELQTDLANGQTIAQIAKSKNVDLGKVIDALVGDASARIDKAVTAGRLTPAQADKLKAALKTEIGNLVNNGFPKGPMMGRGFGGGHRDFGGFGGGPGGAPQPPATQPTA